MAETISRTTLSFYKYARIEDPLSFRDELYRYLFGLNVFGRIYVAHEGINAQVSVPCKNLTHLQDYLNSIPFLKKIRLNIAIAEDGKSFWVLKVKTRDKIVSDGISDPLFDMNHKGKYVDARQFNELSKDPETIIIDMRNHYEYEVGHFHNAIEIPSDTFRQQLPMAVSMLNDQKNKTIIMYCTGGIRCEKASAYMLYKGFKNVFHLEGGIIYYSNQIRKDNLANNYKGKIFVFDDRLGEKVSEEVISNCHQCGNLSDIHTNCKNEGCHLLFIQCDSCAGKYEGCCSQNCQGISKMTECEKRELRKAQQNGIKVFNKSKERRGQLM